MFYTGKINGLIGFYDELNSFQLVEFQIHTNDITKFNCMDKKNALISSSLDGNVAITGLFQNGSINMKSVKYF